MSDSTFTTVGILEESTFGTTPGSALRLVNVREFSPTHEKNSSRPDVLTGNRRRFPSRPLTKTGALTLPTRMQYENDLELMEGLLCNARASAVSISGTTIAFNGTTDVITDSGNGLGSLAVGDLIYVSGASTAANNGWKGPLTAAAAGTITVPDGQVTTESAGATVAIKTRRLLDGSTKKSYSIEGAYTDLTSEYLSVTGSTVAGATYSWAQNEWVDVSYSLVSKFPARGTSSIGTGSATASKVSGYLNSVDDYGSLFYNSGTATSAVFTRLSLQVQNAVNPVNGLGSLGMADRSIGPADITLTASIYYDDSSAASALIDDGESHAVRYFWWHVVDSQGNRMAFCLPAARIETVNVVNGGPGSQRMLELTASIHDAARDSSATLYSATWPYQMGVFFVPA